MACLGWAEWQCVRCLLCTFTLSGCGRQAKESCQNVLSLLWRHPSDCNGRSGVPQLNDAALTAHCVPLAADRRPASLSACGHHDRVLRLFY
jgi:hypothetical protein